MCGRFVSKTDAAMERAFNVTPRQWRHDWTSYNVAPTQMVPVIRPEGGQRDGVMLRWGLVPAWAEGQPTKYSTINARAETIATAATYRAPWKRAQRCIIPAVGYYEWQATPHGKQPHFIHLAGGEPFAFCGLWEASRAPDGAILESCTIITVPANPMVAEIHAKGRMPAMVTPETCGAWLEGTPADAQAVLAPFPAELMDAYPVSSRVNSPRNDGPSLLERVA
ncbi:SOS response-associated peptidase [Aquisalimonas sp.]|uniref:SOS response-associated peptidase n=1 Tax=Aquisalimonas sp. TaxID=1872621 RepID=UPI0025B9CD81|nr:SOS response-associated peptidase [Aquisalimonas sp.]